jgi:hypothetical protein
MTRGRLAAENARSDAALGPWPRVAEGRRGLASLDAGPARVRQEREG